MPAFKGKSTTVDEAEVTINSKISNTITGFTSEDFVFFDFTFTAAEYMRYFINVAKQGNDLLFTTHSVRTGKVASTNSIKDVYTANGIEFLEVGLNEGQDGYETPSFAIAKGSTSESAAAAIKETMNWDLFLIAGGSSSETLYGMQGSFNIIFDNAGDDRIFGGSENDFSVGSGNDTLTGGEGQDTYLFESLASFGANGRLAFTKTITNFDTSQDFINLELLASAYKMRFNSTATSSNWKRGDIIFEVNGSDGWILGNTDRDRDPEFKIVLTGVTSISMNNIDIGQ